MKGLTPVIRVVLGCAGFLWMSTALGVSLAAKKAGVKVYSEATKSSSTVATLAKGDTVEGSERKGLFWQVKTSSGASGFVSIMDVKRLAGSGSGSIAQAIRAASEDGRGDGDEVENTRTRSAVMGVRGLDESSETQFAGNTKPNLRLVYQMEDRQVTKKSLRKLENQVMKELEILAKRRGN